VDDAALTAGALTPPDAVEGVACQDVVLFHFSDADPFASVRDYTVTVSWGDGSSESSAGGPGRLHVVGSAARGLRAVGSHTYSDEASNLVLTVQVDDYAGASIAASGSLNVSDAPLTAGTLTAPDAIEGEIYDDVLFHFSDANPAATLSDYLVNVDWGDG